MPATRLRLPALQLLRSEHQPPRPASCPERLCRHRIASHSQRIPGELSLPQSPCRPAPDPGYPHIPAPSPAAHPAAGSGNTAGSSRESLPQSPVRKLQQAPGQSSGYPVRMALPSALPESRPKMYPPGDSQLLLHSPGNSLAFGPFIPENTAGPPLSVLPI